MPIVNMAHGDKVVQTLHTHFMPALVDKIGRRNRFHPKLGKTKKGNRKEVRIIPSDVEIFLILERYRYLPINFIHKLLPTERNYEAFGARLKLLAAAGYLNRPPQQKESYNAFYRKLVYELGSKGKTYLKDHGIDHGVQIGRGNSYHHELLTCLIIASIEITSKDYRFIHWPELLSFSKVPETTKSSEKPFNIPLAGERRYLIPDGTPFCIHGKRTLCFLGTETDMGNEPLTGTRRDTIKKKFEGYLNIMRNKTYQKHFGFPNMIVPFVTTSEARMNNMMKLLLVVTGGKGCSFIIFKHTPHLRSSEGSPDPVDILKGEWKRAGYPPFNIEEELQK